MRILVSGSSGFIGKHLVTFLEQRGHFITRLFHTTEDCFWKVEGNQSLENLDAVIHLAGESISKGRWTTKKMHAIRQSRVIGTSLLCNTLLKLKYPPKTFLGCSAVGYYGNAGEKLLDETADQGTGFLSDVVAQWENASISLPSRRVLLRMGVVLDPMGGALKTMALPFRIGFGGKIGSGNQYMSWISLRDAISAISYLLEDQSIKGPVNMVSPFPVTNATLTLELGKALRRPTLFPLPAFIARLALGKIADELLLSSTRAEPTVLMRSKFVYRNPELGPFLKSVL